MKPILVSIDSVIKRKVKASFIKKENRQNTESIYYSLTSNQPSSLRHSMSFSNRLLPRQTPSLPLLPPFHHLGLGTQERVIQILRQIDLRIQRRHLPFIINHFLLINPIHILRCVDCLLVFFLQFLEGYLQFCQLVLKALVFVGQTGYLDLVLTVDLVDLHLFDGLEL